MLTRFYKLCLGLFASQALLTACAAPQLQGSERFVIYYNDKAPVEAFEPFQLLVLDTEYHPDLNKLNKRHTLLGYVSLAELKPGKENEVSESLLIRQNTQWGSTKVDIRQPEWKDRLLGDVIPNALNKGFDGIMLDTVDSALYLEATQPEDFAGMKESAVHLIQSIRQQYPTAKIMLNRGFEIHPYVSADIDMILAESILSHYDLQANKASFAPDDVYAHYVQKLNQTRQQYPHIRVYSIDYWDTNDSKNIKNIYRIQRAQGFIPYVATPNLTTIYPEPQASSSWLTSKASSHKEEI